MGTRMAVTAPRAGFYQPTRHNESTIEKLNTLLGSSRLTVGTDGTVHFKEKDWAPQPDGSYRAGDGTDRLVFLAGTGGRRYVATDGPSYQLMTMSETLPFNLLILLAVVLPALGALPLPVVWAVRRTARRPTTTWRAARTLAAGSAVLGVAFLAALAATLLGNTDEFLYHVPPSFRLLLGVPVIVLGAAVVATALTVKGWRGSKAGVIARVHQITLLTGVAALAWFLWQWNLIGWQYA